MKKLDLPVDSLQLKTQALRDGAAARIFDIAVYLNAIEFHYAKQIINQEPAAFCDYSFALEFF